MPVLTAPPAPTHEVGGTRFTSLTRCLPVGGQACLPDGATFTPPWAL